MSNKEIVSTIHKYIKEHKDNLDGITPKVIRRFVEKKLGMDDEELKTRKADISKWITMSLAKLDDGSDDENDHKSKKRKYASNLDSKPRKKVGLRPANSLLPKLKRLATAAGVKVRSMKLNELTDDKAVKVLRKELIELGINSDQHSLSKEHLQATIDELNLQKELKELQENTGAFLGNDELRSRRPRKAVKYQESEDDEAQEGASVASQHSVKERPALMDSSSSEAESEAESEVKYDEESD